MAQIGNHTNIKIEEDLLRHMCLNSLRSYNVKFREQYGEMIIACDDKISWRRNVFPYYKANRRKERAKSEIDWNCVFAALNKIRDELIEFFPYRVIHINNAEADDVIASLCHHFGDDEQQQIIIISGDKDFRQLQRYSNVSQYDPIRKRMIKEDDPVGFLKRHIMEGDRGDGIPNFLSRDDTFVLPNRRQKPLRSNKVNQWVALNPEDFCDDEMIRGWKRNELLVDLSNVPQSIQIQVIESFHAQQGKTRSKLYMYFIDNSLKHLLSDIDQF